MGILNGLFVRQEKNAKVQNRVFGNVGILVMCGFLLQVQAIFR